MLVNELDIMATGSDQNLAASWYKVRFPNPGNNGREDEIKEIYNVTAVVGNTRSCGTY